VPNLRNRVRLPFTDIERRLMNLRVVCLLTAALLLPPTAVAAQPEPDPSAIASLRETGKAFAAVARAVSPSVVFIQVESRARAQPNPFGPGSPFGDDFLRRFFGDQFPGTPQEPAPGERNRVTGQGSGFVFRSNGDKAFILTNNHVVQNAERIRVRFEDGREFDATVTGSDPQSDVAVIEVDEPGLPALPLARSAELEVGEWVVAIGSPFGLRSTLTVGVVSATGRTSLGINDYEDFIQTDAAINPGNSGGPLVNLDGEVVGMNTAIFSRSGGYMGIGFAIPIDLARAMADQLIDSGEVTRGFLGVAIQPLTPELAESFGIDRSEGILVADVTNDSPAAKAGIEVGDVIVGFQGNPVRDVGDFRNRVALTPPGTRARIAVLRDGKRRELTVRIGTLDAAAAAAGPGGETTDRQLGLTVRSPSAEAAEALGLAEGQGVIIAEVAPGSVAASAGLSRGMAILEVNRQRVNSPAEFLAAVEQSSDKRAVLLVRSRQGQQYVVLRW
jgi:serine protease Do